METVESRDGTTIAYERTGSGPPLVLVHGMAGDHTRWDLFGVRRALAEHTTVYAMDRRGRGGSGDAAEYDLEREFEDVAAVVEAVDEPVALLGHSFGATCALEAPLRTDNIRNLILYESTVPWEIIGPHLYSDELHTKLETLVDAGQHEAALVLFLEGVVELPPAQIDELRAAPSWQARVDGAHTLPREYRAPAEYDFDPTWFEELTVPTVLLVGGESPQWAKDAVAALDKALPNSRIEILEGQGHAAMNTAPGRFVETVLEIVREPESRSSGAVSGSMDR